ncbi:ROK family protein [Kineococcus sp. SYSU DK005]|uniref:ROK family protein n=1 Tax=Kineococcus sp. SYSU DK005 TaxID=3383126 RepID=UPI003D7D1951
MVAPPRPAAVRRGSNLPRVGDYNRVVVLDAVRRHAEGLSRVELAALTGLSAQTVSNICRHLIEQGLVVEAGKQGVGPGKPRTILRLAPSGRYAVGVHLDPVVATTVVLDLRGGVVARSDVPLAPEAPAQETLARVAAEVSATVAAAGVPAERIAGLGVAVPGPVDGPAGEVVGAPNLPGWARVPVREALSGATGLPVLLDKDVVAAAVAEMWAGGAGPTGSFAFVYLGTGIGAGLVLRGEVLRGASGNAGEVGHLAADGTGPRCACGQRGCLGERNAPRAMVLQAQEAGLGPWPLDGVLGVDRALGEVCRLADEGVPAAVAVLDAAAARVARAVSGVQNLLDLDLVVFGGPLWPRLERRFLQVVPPLVRAREVAAPLHAVQIRGTRVGRDVAAVGAACLVLDDAFSPRSSVLLLGS